MTTRTIPRGDSALISYRLQKADGSYQDLTGYAVRLIVKRNVDDPDDPAVPRGAVLVVTATLRAGAATYADAIIAAGALDEVGVFAACFEASNESTGDRHSLPFTLTTTEHA